MTDATTPDANRICAWAGWRFAVVGGDEREQEIARLAAATGGIVKAFAIPWPAAGIAGVEVAGSLEAAVHNADYLLLPIPGLAVDGSVYAPASPLRVVVDARVFAQLRSPAAVFLGRADTRLRQAATAAGVDLVEYESDLQMMLERGPAIAEGALAHAIELSDVTIHRSAVVVVGHGTIGALLTRTMVALGARVHVVARNPVQRAEASVAGAEAHPLDELGEVLARADFLLSTVPALVVAPDELARMRPGGVVLDLAAPPGGVDLEAATRLGLRARWARGLGGRAPVTVGRSQWNGIARRIEERTRERT